LSVVLCLAFVASLQGEASPIPLEDAGDAGLADLAGDIRLAAVADRVPVYRFWSPVSGKHFFTIDPAERDMLIREYADFWNSEGIAYYVYASNSESGLMPVYRFWSPVLVSHFYTISETERDMLINEYGYVWTSEGTAFHAYPEGRQPGGASAVYRFWSPLTAAHFFTIDEAERDMLINEYAYAWTYEGVAWYAFKDPNNGVEPPILEGGTYEFSGGSDSASCTLTLKAYVDGAEAAIDDPQLTFGSQNGYLKMTADFDALTATIQEVLIESAPSLHTTTVRGTGNVVIPVTLASSVIFWGTTVRGPLEIDPQTLTFPVAGETAAGGNETFTQTGSITINGNKLTIGLAVRATRFAEGQGTFEDGASSELLNVRVNTPFQWSRSGREDRLFQTLVDGHQLQLYITGAQLQMTGLWEGMETD
jgi:hypothetical protein